MSLKWVLPSVVGAAILFSSLTVGQEKTALTPAEAKATLEAAGFKVTPQTGVTFAEESDFAKKMKDLGALRKNLYTAEKELAATELALERLKQTITGLKAEAVKMNAALVGNLTITENNRLVGALNAISGQIDLLLTDQEKGNDQLKAARGRTNDAREAFVEQVLKLRIDADRITQQWEKAAADPRQQLAMEKVNEVLNKKFALRPTVAFAASERQLKMIEGQVLSETIKLTDDGGTPVVSVVINGKHTKEMVVDSGASTVSLPWAMAKEMGLEPNSTDPEIVVSLADGSEVPAYLKKIDSVRVGKFTVENVECVVLHARAVKAPALLGMSFLGNFKFELDKNQNELKMVKVDIDAKGK